MAIRSLLGQKGSKLKIKTYWGYVLKSFSQELQIATICVITIQSTQGSVYSILLKSYPHNQFWEIYS